MDTQELLDRLDRIVEDSKSTGQQPQMFECFRNLLTWADAINKLTGTTHVIACLALGLALGSLAVRLLGW